MFLAQGQNTNGLYMGQTLIVLTICVAVRFICEKLAVRASCQASVDVKQVLAKGFTGKCSVWELPIMNRFQPQR